MDKRTILFVVLSSTVMVAYFGLTWWMGQAQREQAQRDLARQQAAAVADAPDGDASAADDPDAPDADGPDAGRPAGDATRTAPTEADLTGPVPPVETSDPGNVPAASVAAGDETGRTALVEEPSDRVRQERLITLGSLDEASPLKLLATISTRGAAIVRVELNNPRYRDLDIHRAWIGSLELIEEPGADDPRLSRGLRVRAVGAGTPAAAAGLAVGDVIVGADGTPVLTVGQWLATLEPKQPGEPLALDVLAGPGGQRRAVTVTPVRAPVSVVTPGDAKVGASGVRLSYGTTLVNGADVLQGRPEGPRSLAGLTERNWTLVPADGPAADEGDDPNASDSDPDDDAFEPSAYVRTVAAGGSESGGTAGQRVVFETELSDAECRSIGWTGPATLRKVYTIREASGAEDPGLHLTMRLEIAREDAAETPVAWSIDGAVGLPDEGWWYANKIHTAWFSAVGARDVMFNTVATGHKLLGGPDIATSTARDQAADLILFSGHSGGAGADTRQVRYVGVDGQYFDAAILPATVPPSDGTATMPLWEARAVAVGPVNVETSVAKKSTNTSFVLTTEPARVEAGTTAAEYTLFFGPKEPEVLARYGLGEAIYYGWFWFVTEVLLWVLHFFQSIVGSYAIAIIMLTIVVRLCLFPLSRKMAVNAAKMQSLGPEMKALKEKYPDDPLKMQQAQRDLFKKHNFNPLGGCWMAFVQLPIFMGLYRGLATDIQLRGAPLIPGIPWASDLSGPDMALYWGTGAGAGLEWIFAPTGWLGPWLNLLPLGTVALFMLQQKLFMPPATDEQTQMQQRMMTMMMVVIGLMFFKVPSGLCVYFLTSSTWAICERLLLKKITPTPELPAATESTSTSGPKAGGSNGSAAPPQPSKRRSRNA